MILGRDMKRSVSSYHDNLGLPLRIESPGWAEVAAFGAILTLHLSEKSAATRSVAQVAAAGNCRPGLRVPSLDDFHRRMVEEHMRWVQELKDDFGSRLAQYVDPDALTISGGEEPPGSWGSMFTAPADRRAGLPAAFFPGLTAGTRAGRSFADGDLRFDLQRSTRAN